MRRHLSFVLFLNLLLSCSPEKQLIFCGNTQNDIYGVLEAEGFVIKHYDDAGEAIGEADEGMPVLIMSDDYRNPPRPSRRR